MYGSAVLPSNNYTTGGGSDRRLPAPSTMSTFASPFPPAPLIVAPLYAHTHTRGQSPLMQVTTAAALHSGTHTADPLMLHQPHEASGVFQGMQQGSTPKQEVVSRQGIASDDERYGYFHQ
jgi:hypothetical protein